eukprot:5232865-Amphidinium_carterae.1
MVSILRFKVSFGVDPRSIRLVIAQRHVTRSMMMPVSGMCSTDEFVHDCISCLSKPLASAPVKIQSHLEV